MKPLQLETSSMTSRVIEFFLGGPADNQQSEMVSGYSPTPSRSQTSRLYRKSVGILYADIADYARLTEQDEEGTHRSLVELMGIMKSQVAAHKGRIAHFAGDALLVEFNSAESALHCAVKVQLSVRKWNRNVRQDKQIFFRIGVNFGNVILDEDDLYGNAVNLAARLEQLACCGGICVSEAVRSKLSDNTEIRFIAIGKQYVKNIEKPVLAFWIVVRSKPRTEPGISGIVEATAIAN